MLVSAISLNPSTSREAGSFFGPTQSFAHEYSFGYLWRNGSFQRSGNGYIGPSAPIERDIEV